MRAFIALPLDEAVRDALCRCRDVLRQRAGAGRMVRRENLHLTLAFLGEISPEQVGAAAGAMASAAGAPFALRLAGLGRFPGRAGDTWWVGLEESAPLRALERRLRRNLTAAGFVLEKRNFSPHLTLGRGLRLDLAPGEISAPPLLQQVREMVLFSSALSDGRRVYTPLARTALQEHRRNL